MIQNREEGEACLASDTSHVGNFSLSGAVAGQHHTL